MKTYCISDLHGHLANLDRFLEKAGKKDRIFVLGDVIDKGPDSVAILQKIMMDDRITMLLGNHEHMMWQYLKSGSVSDYFQWVVLNHGIDTFRQYEKLSDEEKNAIMDFIENLPLNIPDLKVRGREYYLVHAMPVGMERVTMKDLGYDSNLIAEYVWSRWDGEKLLDDRTVIAGHTPVQFYGYSQQPFCSSDSITEADYIDIDGGLAGSMDTSTLIALCLDDLSFKTY